MRAIARRLGRSPATISYGPPNHRTGTGPPVGQVGTPPRTHATIADHPPRYLLAIGLRRVGRVRDEPTALLRSPEHLYMFAPPCEQRTSPTNTLCIICVRFRRACSSRHDFNCLLHRGRRVLRGWRGRGMTDPMVRLETPLLSVDPGGQARSVVRIRNLSSIVEGFRLQVLGVGATDWGEVSPAEVEVLPDQEVTATVTFSPPVDVGTRSGIYPFGIRAESVVNSATCAVAEGDLEIGTVYGLQSNLAPTASSGRRFGRHSATLTNLANTPVRLRITAGDPEAKLAIAINPHVVALLPGASCQAQVNIKAKSWIVSGAPKRTSFQVIAEPDESQNTFGPSALALSSNRALMEGAFSQLPIISRFTLIVGTIALLIVGGVATYALTRPTERDAANISQDTSATLVTSSTEAMSTSPHETAPSTSTEGGAASTSVASATPQTPTRSVIETSSNLAAESQNGDISSDVSEGTVAALPDLGSTDAPPQSAITNELAAPEQVGTPLFTDSSTAAPLSATSPSKLALVRGDRPVTAVVITVITPPNRPNPNVIQCKCSVQFGIKFAPSQGYSDKEAEEILRQKLVWTVYQVEQPKAAQYSSGLTPTFPIEQYSGKNIAVKAELPGYTPAISDLDGFYVNFSN